MSERTNLIDTIAGTDIFSAFARMMRTSKANEILSGGGPFTVFVPTNDAWGKIPDAQMNGWLSETDQTRLNHVLAYHIVPGKLFASDLERASPAMSLSGQEITLTDKGGLKVNTSGLQARNIEATDGIIHGLDTVLTPPAIPAATAVGSAVTATAPAPPVMTAAESLATRKLS
ncbi:MAG TPA: fasciclin domain-containing protein [Pyrinomonadaceae bacterium]|nr:fasciclin domain-containing protein [Pyrinomonadaceae bacterium]